MVTGAGRSVLDLVTRELDISRGRPTPFGATPARERWGGGGPSVRSRRCLVVDTAGKSPHDVEDDERACPLFDGHDHVASRTVALLVGAEAIGR